MKKLVVLTVLLMVAPALAVPSNVDITVAKTGTNELTVSYSTDANLVSAFGLEIIIDDPCISIASVDCSGNADYDIYPGSIVITGGVAGPWGQCLADGSYPGTPDDPNHKTIEAGCLYAEGEDPPASSGPLAVVTLAGCDSVGAETTCLVRVIENVIRGGVVMEDPDEVPTVSEADGEVGHDLDICSCYGGMADWDQFVLVGQPECWCYPRQCHGDADGLPYGLGGYWVAVPDLTILKNAWNKPFGSLVGNEICADFDRLPYGLGAYRVAVPDLTILKANWNTAATPADCPPGNRTP